ncbi:AMIN domain-containing protein [Actinomyces sp. 2119]|uniref:AMIN domain-containing protein n=1 Tax=Actinomyces lilanjuaniae TaxID=2321394 RepID=A0ABM6Z3W6_9ACTO|nr:MULTISPECIES: AMIN domain-containing protein [Actinomyces]AYD90025.1 AMIN domain-containing protein [Actinomyces lilanjuaniae]RJF42526.1 AMIN domain-containing protein [Actinomyces sp. 2119]
MRHRVSHPATAPASVLLTVPLVVSLLALLGLGACSTQAAGSAGSRQDATTSASASSATSPTTSPAPASPPVAAASQVPTTTGVLTQKEQGSQVAPSWGSGSQGQDAAEDSALVITDVRVGSHDDEGYDRIVIELAGNGAPGWSALWTDQAYSLGKGDPIAVSGDYTLVVTGTGATMPTTPEQQELAYTGTTRFDMDAKGIEQAHVNLTVEDQFQVVLGTGSQTYRVFTLSSPTRLVIDVADDAAGELGDGEG